VAAAAPAAAVPAVEHGIIRHATSPFSALGDEETSVSRRPDATHAGGVGHYKKKNPNPRQASGELGASSL
jgi:hypothetical protein